MFLDTQKMRHALLPFSLGLFSVPLLAFPGRILAQAAVAAHSLPSVERSSPWTAAL